MQQSTLLVDAYKIARTYKGLKEIVGGQHEKQIVKFFSEVGHSWVKDDETAWCAAFVGAMLERAGIPSTRKLNARSYLNWGEEVKLKDAQPGDIVVFTRGNPEGWQGHVGFYVGHGSTAVSVLGGNQSNSVNITPYRISRLLGVRRWPVQKAKSWWRRLLDSLWKILKPKKGG